MRSVRCDNCGKKALIAASKCPQCGHLFDLRDSFGELLPMAHCSTCDSDYPVSRGSCRWCGPKRAGRGASSFARVAAALVAVAAVGAVSWFTWQRVGAGEEVVAAPAPPAEATAAATVPAVRQVAANTPAPDPVRSHVVDSGLVVAALDTAPATPRTMSTVATGDVGRELVPVAASVTPRESAPLPGVSVSPRRDRPSQGMPRRSSITVASLAAVTQEWTQVHASANRDAPVVGTVGPETRVQLGETRGAWVRLRSGALSGWAERRQFVVR